MAWTGWLRSWAKVAAIWLGEMRFGPSSSTMLVGCGWLLQEGCGEVGDVAGGDHGDGAVERVEVAGDDARLDGGRDVPGGVFHEPGGAEEGDGDGELAEFALDEGVLAEQVGFAGLGADGGEVDDSIGMRGGEGGLERGGCSAGFGEVGGGIEDGWDDDEDGFGALEGCGEGGWVEEVGLSDFAAEFGPGLGFGGVADDGADGKSGCEKGSGDFTAYVACDSGDGVHGDLLRSRSSIQV